MTLHRGRRWGDVKRRDQIALDGIRRWFGVGRAQENQRRGSEIPAPVTSNVCADDSRGCIICVMSIVCGQHLRWCDESGFGSKELGDEVEGRHVVS